MIVRILLQGGHSVEISPGRTWGTDNLPSSTPEAVAWVRSAIAQSSPLTDRKGGTVVIERPDSVVGYTVAQ